jgi:hypothetical protein
MTERDLTNFVKEYAEADPLAGINAPPLSETALREILAEPRNVTWANGLAMAAELWRVRETRHDKRPTTDEVSADLFDALEENERLRRVNEALTEACRAVLADLDLGGIIPPFGPHYDRLRAAITLADSPAGEEITATYRCWGCKEVQALQWPAKSEVVTPHGWPPSAVRCDCGEIMNRIASPDCEDPPAGPAKVSLDTGDGP